MTEGVPPLAEIHPMKAMLQIPLNDPPFFSLPEFFSEEMLDFVRCCLQKQSDTRFTAHKLLYHPFILKFSGQINRHSFVTKLLSDQERRLQHLKSHDPMDTMYSFNTVRAPEHKSPKLGEIEFKTAEVSLRQGDDRFKTIRPPTHSSSQHSFISNQTSDSMIIYDDASSSIINFDSLDSSFSPSPVIKQRGSLAGRLHTFKDNLALGLEKITPDEVIQVFRTIIERSSELLPLSVQTFFQSNDLLLMFSDKILRDITQENESEDETEEYSPWHFLERLGETLIKKTFD